MRHMAKKHNSVVGMLKDVLPDDKDLQVELCEQLGRRHLVRQLAKLRNEQGVSQKKIADRLKCGQSRVSKLENGYDDEVTLRDIGAYADALECDVEVILRRNDLTLVDQVKYHAFQIKDCFDRLADLAKKDDDVAKGVADFHIEALFNLAEIVKKSAARIPKAKKKDRRHHIDLSLQKSGSGGPPVRRLSAEPCDIEN